MNGVLATVRFTVYLTKDSRTCIIFTPRNDTTQLPCSLTTLSQSSTATLDYNYLCGECSLANFLRDGSLIHITSIRPNPAQDQLEIYLQSNAGQDVNIDLFNSLGMKIFSKTRLLGLKDNQIIFDTRDLVAEVYFVRVGGDSA